MSSAKVPIFYTGATGYIGGAVLRRILDHPQASTFDITALVRDANKTQILQSKFGVKAVVGSLQDHKKLTELSEAAHIVLQTADADDEEAMKAILAGLKRRHEKTGDVPILIHTSGAVIITDDARGEFASSDIKSDLDISMIDSIPRTVIHHAVDLLVTDADAEGYVRASIVVPSQVYGTATGPLFDAGVSKWSSIAVPLLAQVWAKRGRAGVVGGGKTVWMNVHWEDNADVYYRLFSRWLTNLSGLGHGREGYYFVGNDGYTHYDLCKKIGESLVALGVAQEAEPTVLTPEERVKYFGSDLFAFLVFTNARFRPDRATRDLGWKPTHTTEDVWKHIPEVVREVVDQMRVGDMGSTVTSDRVSPHLKDQLAA